MTTAAPLPADAPGDAETATRRLAVLVLLGGALNGVAVHLAGFVAAGGGLSLTMGLSPFQVIAIFVATRLSLDPSPAVRPLPMWPAWLALALILVPSSAVAWLAVAGYAAVVARRTQGERRAGALLFLAVALAALWSSLALKWLAVPVTSAEAWVIGKAVALFRPDIVQTGNVIGNPEVHSLVLMTACTTADALPAAAIALVATALLLGGLSRTRAVPALVLLAVIYAVANIARLGAMSLSGDHYALLHGPVGANLFDLFQTAAVLLLGNWASRP